MILWASFDGLISRDFFYQKNFDAKQFCFLWDGQRTLGLAELLYDGWKERNMYGMKLCILVKCIVACGPRGRLYSGRRRGGPWRGGGGGS
jgi:hypothetical protein